ncbi:hypothetical protein [Schlesneria sp. T3-172]|uniref:hypothetical protein n=1 Tax=Schlesneria sphaerica TaxID=3373610 RepID=UPI0037C6AD86
MKSGRTAYAEYHRIHAENGVKLPTWDGLRHIQRMAWEAVFAHITDPENRPLSISEYRPKPVPKQRKER